MFSQFSLQIIQNSTAVKLWIRSGLYIVLRDHSSITDVSKEVGMAKYWHEQKIRKKNYMHSKKRAYVLILIFFSALFYMVPFYEHFFQTWLYLLEKKVVGYEEMLTSYFLKVSADKVGGSKKGQKCWSNICMVPNSDPKGPNICTTY